MAVPITDFRVMRLVKTAQMPVKATEGSAGYDLFASEETTVPARGQVLVATGLSVVFPDGTYGRIAPRSGLAFRNGIDVGAGVVDPDYTGSVGVILFNHSEEDFVIKVGDRIAQIILTKYVSAPVVEVKEVERTQRGSGGFGSTGK